MDQTEFPTISFCDKNQFSTEYIISFIRDRLKSEHNLSFNNVNDSKKKAFDVLPKFKERV